MAQSELDPVGRGVQAGVARIRRYKMASDPEVLNSAMLTMYELFREPAFQASARFIELFGELVTVAVSARASYGEEALTGGQIREYALQSFDFFNDWRRP